MCLQYSWFMMSIITLLLMNSCIHIITECYGKLVLLIFSNNPTTVVGSNLCMTNGVISSLKKELVMRPKSLNLAAENNPS